MAVQLLIELISSSKLSLLNIFLGWYLPLTISLIEILFLTEVFFVSPIRDDIPRPNPFFCFKNTQAALSIILSWSKNSSVKLKYDLLPGQDLSYIKTGIPCDGASDNLTFLE